MSATLPSWYAGFFRFGHLAKGIIYLIIGGLAIATIVGNSGGVEGGRGVIQWINEQPLGRFLLGLIAIGLLSYTAWRWLKVFLGKGGDEDDKKDAVYRVAWFFSGLSYLGLGVLAARAAINGGTSGGEGSGRRQEIITWLMQQSWGPTVVVILGLVIAGVAIFQLIKGLKEKYLDNIDLSSVDHKERKSITKLGKIGHLARAAVFAIMAYFLVLAGATVDPDKFRGTEGALEWLHQHNYGTILLGLAAAGLIAYAIFTLAKAKYPPKEVK